MHLTRNLEAEVTIAHFNNTFNIKDESEPYSPFLQCVNMLYVS